MTMAVNVSVVLDVILCAVVGYVHTGTMLDVPVCTYRYIQHRTLSQLETPGSFEMLVLVYRTSVRLILEDSCGPFKTIEIRLKNFGKTIPRTCRLIGFSLSCLVDVRTYQA
jgi:hypothetical protein